MQIPSCVCSYFDPHLTIFRILWLHEYLNCRLKFDWLKKNQANWLPEPVTNFFKIHIILFFHKFIQMWKVNIPKLAKKSTNWKTEKITHLFRVLHLFAMAQCPCFALFSHTISHYEKRKNMLFKFQILMKLEKEGERNHTALTHIHTHPHTHPHTPAQTHPHTHTQNPMGKLSEISNKLFKEFSLCMMLWWFNQLNGEITSYTLLPFHSALFTVYPKIEWQMTYQKGGKQKGFIQKAMGNNHQKIEQTPLKSSSMHDALLI